jgi:hypothetical protein
MSKRTVTTPDPVTERMKEILGPEWYKFSSEELVIAHIMAAEELMRENVKN